MHRFVQSRSARSGGRGLSATGPAMQTSFYAEVASWRRTRSSTPCGPLTPASPPPSRTERSEPERRAAVVVTTVSDRSV